MRERQPRHQSLDASMETKNLEHQEALENNIKGEEKEEVNEKRRRKWPPFIEQAGAGVEKHQPHPWSVGSYSVMLAEQDQGLCLPGR